MICATKFLLFLIKHNIPHTTVFKDCVDFATNVLKCPDLQHLRQGKNATYTSTTIVNELMKLKRRVLKSPGYAKMNAETTGNTNKKHLALCVKYINMDSCSTCVNYVKDVRINYGKAETIFNETRTVINDLSNNKFVAFASDGCNTIK
jgi:hypothetical protein